MGGTLQNGSFYGGVRGDRCVGGLTLAETGYGPGFEVPPHDHAHPFFCLALAGTFRERFEGRAWTARPTTVFFHPSGAEHSERFGGRGGRLFNVQLGGAWLARLERFDIRPPQRQVETMGGRLAWVASALYREFRLDDVASHLAIDGLALALLAQVVRHDRIPPSGSRPAWLARVEELLQDRFDQPMDIAGLAAEVDIHPVHLARVFRRHHHCSPAEYLRRIRVRRACEMLADGDETLSAIAFATGFADQSHFTRNFRRALGVTPGKYRRVLAGAPG
jgi:AraC family transcriptional regulator